MEKSGSRDGFRKLRISDFKTFVVYSHDVQFVLLLFLPCLSQFGKPIVHTTNLN